MIIIIYFQKIYLYISKLDLKKLNIVTKKCLNTGLKFYWFGVNEFFSCVVDMSHTLEQNELLKLLKWTVHYLIAKFMKAGLKTGTAMKIQCCKKLYQKRCSLYSLIIFNKNPNFLKYLFIMYICHRQNKIV